MKIPQPSQFNPIRQDVSRRTGDKPHLPEDKNDQATFDILASHETKKAPNSVFAVSDSSGFEHSNNARLQFSSLFKESQQKAIDLYNITASLNTLGGEGDLIGVDIYI